MTVKSIRSRWLWIMVVTALLLSVTIVPFRRPTYHGKPLGDWIRKIDYDTTEEPMRSDSIKAVAAVRALGTNVLPDLLRMLERRDSPLKLRLVELARRQRLIRIPFTPARLWHIRAGNGLRALGPHAEAAIPVLTGYFLGKDESLASIAANVLGEIGPPAFPILTPALTNAAIEIRFRALGALANRPLAKHPNQVIPILRDVVTRGSDDLMKLYAAIQLGQLGREEELVVHVLVEGMERYTNDLRADAIRALLKFPARAREQMALIRRLAEDNKDLVGKSAAEEALKQIESWAPPTPEQP